MQNSDTLIDREHRVIYQTYKRLPISIDRAEGCRIHASDGTVYLDMLAGIAVNALGHSHPRLIAAAEAQLKRYLHVSNFFYQEPQVRLAEMLCARSGYSKVVFTNSGAEAWDAAMKLARAYGSTRDHVGDIIAFKGGFHGRTYGALSVMDKPLYKKGMEPFLPATQVLPYNDIEALRNAVNHSTCAVALEFIQGEGGISVASDDFVRELVQLREKYGFVIIADEVQTGVGRSGDFFAFEHYGFRPDIVTMAKGIGGGLPLGALLASEQLSTVWQQGQHGTTYGGNALACVTGMVVMEEIERGLMDNVRSMGAILRAELEKLQTEYPTYIIQVRGRGLMLGLALGQNSTPLRDALIARKVITSATADTVIRLVPPLIIGRQEIDEFMIALRSAVAECSAAAA